MARGNHLATVIGPQCPALRKVTRMTWQTHRLRQRRFKQLNNNTKNIKTQTDRYTAKNKWTNDKKKYKKRKSIWNNDNFRFPVSGFYEWRLSILVVDFVSRCPRIVGGVNSLICTRRLKLVHQCNFTRQLVTRPLGFLTLFTAFSFIIYTHTHTERWWPNRGFAWRMRNTARTSHSEEMWPNPR